MSNTPASPPDEPKKRQGKVFAVFYGLAVLMGFFAIQGPLNGTPDAFLPGVLSCVVSLAVGWILERLKI